MNHHYNPIVIHNINRRQCGELFQKLCNRMLTIIGAFIAIFYALTFVEDLKKDIFAYKNLNYARDQNQAELIGKTPIKDSYRIVTKLANISAELLCYFGCTDLQDLTLQNSYSLI
jgi:hypothetical protein